MSVSVGINRDATVDFSISDVKKAIENVSAAAKTKYVMKSKNDLMNSFSLNLVGGLVVVPVTIQLKKITDSQTQITLVSEKITQSPNQTKEIVDNYLGFISKSLSGETLDEKTIRGKGCMVFLIPIVAIGLYFLLN